MNTLISGVSNAWTALVFGAVFNWLTASQGETLIAFAIKTAIGGAIWLVFQLIADYVKNRNAIKAKSKEHENEKKSEQR